MNYELRRIRMEIERRLPQSPASIVVAAAVVVPVPDVAPAAFAGHVASATAVFVVSLY